MQNISKENTSRNSGWRKNLQEIFTNKKSIKEAKIDPKTKNNHIGKVIFEDGAIVDESALTDTQKANLNGIKLLAELSSVEFHIFRSDKVGNTFKYTMPNGTVTSANGWFVSGTNQIWVDLNAGNAGQGTMIRTAAHEISHYIKAWSPAKWKAMADLLMKSFAENGVNTESMLNKQIDKIKRRYTEKNMPSEAELLDMAYEELVCDALSDMFTDGSIVNFMAKVKKQDRSLWQKIKDAVKDLLNKWGLVIEDYKGRELETDEAQALSQFEDTFKKLQEMYRDAFMDANNVVAAVGNAQAQKNTTGEGGVKLQDSRSVYSEYNKPITLEDIKTLRDIGRKSINDFSTDEVEVAQKWAYKFYQQLSTKSPFFRRWFGDWRAFDNNPIEKVDKKADNRGEVTNKDTGWVIKTSRQVHKETKAHRGKTEQNAVKYLPYIDDITKKAVLFDTFVSDDKNENSMLFHTMYAYTDVFGYPALLKLRVEELYYYGDKNSGVLLRDYILQNIEEESVSESNRLSRPNQSKTNSSVNSISDLFDFVKTYDLEFKPKPVNEALINKADGTPKVFYHGTSAEFTEFDKRKSKSGFYGKGFYFTTEKSHANQYGKEMEVYLNIKNPLLPGQSNVTKNQIVKFLEAVSENEDYSIENYGTYDVDKIVNNITSRDAFDVIQDINATAIGDFGEALQLFNEVNGTEFDGIIAPTETVVYNANQIKSAEDGVNIGTFSEAESDIRYSERDYSYEALVNKPDMKLTVVGESVPGNRADVVALAKRNAASVGKINKDGSVSVYVDDTNTDVIITKKSLVHGLDRRMSTQSPVLIKIGEILKNSIRINEMTPRATDVKNTYVLIGAARGKNENIYVASFVVNKYSNEITEIDVLYSANAKKESAALLPKFTDKSATPTDSVISISDLLDYVNKYFPDILPESVLKHFGHQERPAGKLGENALFSNRDTDTSNRSILANALESIVQNEAERNRLEVYKEKISLIEKAEQRRFEIQKKLFTKGTVKDSKERRDLQIEAKQIANRINIYDRQLLKLESTTALRNVLNREKSLAMKKQKQRDAEQMKAYKEKVAKTTGELIEKHPH